MMIEAAGVGSQLDILDNLISKLELLITQADEEPLVITYQDPPRRAIYRPIGNIASTFDRKAKSAEATLLDEGKLVLRCRKTELVRLMSVEVMVLGGKNGRGEVSFIITGTVGGLKRVRGGYDLDITISETRRVQVTPGQRLRESVEKNDSGGWNRWCQDIKDTINLAGINLANADLAGYDLCSTDLTGADLSGADLTNAILAGADISHANLDQAKVTGADFFRAKVRQEQVRLVVLSGMPEKESVIVSEETRQL